MTIHTILTEPNPILRKISSPVEAVTDEIRALMDDMLETMYAANGIGLAAIQIGIEKRVIVMDLNFGSDLPPEPRYFVNPVVTVVDDTPCFYKEGCLSVPEINDMVARPAKVQIDFLDYHGNPQTILADELLATCIQHEMDHLEGILFLDRLPKLKRQMALQKLRKKNSLKLV